MTQDQVALHPLPPTDSLGQTRNRVLANRHLMRPLNGKQTAPARVQEEFTEAARQSGKDRGPGGAAGLWASHFTSLSL